MKLFRKLNQKGMTIKELIVVAGIILAMAGAAIPLFHYLRNISPMLTS